MGLNWSVAVLGLLAAAHLGAAYLLAADGHSAAAATIAVAGLGAGWLAWMCGRGE